MAVVGTAKERVNRREKRITESSIWYKRVYVVEVSSAKDDQRIVETAFGLPQYGYHYVTERSFDARVHAKRFYLKQIAPTLWDVEVEYDDKIDIVGNNGLETPLLEKPTWKWGGYQVRRVVTGQSTLESLNPQDPSAVILLDSTGILNSAYEPYNPPAEIDAFIPTLTFTRNEPRFNHRYMLYYVNSVNVYPWYGWFKRTVKCADIKGEFKTKVIMGEEHPYWRVSYTFHFNPETWDLFLLDHGSYYLTTDLKKKPFVEKGVPKIGLLTSSGHAATDVSTPPIANYKRFRVLRELDFTRLMIPIPR